MSGERGQRTRLRFGAVSAEVSLVKASTKPKGAEHETRRVLVDTPPVTGPPIPEGERWVPPPGTAAITEVSGVLDPFGDPVAEDDVVPAETGRDPLADPDWRERATEPQRQRVDHDVDPTHPDTPPDPVRLDEDHFERRQAEAIASMRGPAHDPDLAAAVERGEHTMDTEDRAYERQAAGIAPAAPAPTYVPPATRVEQGVHLETGEWVDLTDRLAEVDRLTRVDGLEVVRTIPASSYASERVRECYYLAGVDPTEYKVLSLLWRALRLEGKAAEVRWTKVKAQATGIILARGGGDRTPPHLALLELEWAANVRKPSARATGPIGAEVSTEEVHAAAELVRAFAAPAPREELRDERLAKRAELLALAKAGELEAYTPPAEPMPEDLGGDADVAEALALAAAWQRDHAPA